MGYNLQKRQRTRGPPQLPLSLGLSQFLPHLPNLGLTVPGLLLLSPSPNYSQSQSMPRPSQRHHYDWRASPIQRKNYQDDSGFTWFHMPPGCCSQSCSICLKVPGPRTLVRGLTHWQLLENHLSNIIWPQLATFSTALVLFPGNRCFYIAVVP